MLFYRKLSSLLIPMLAIIFFFFFLPFSFFYMDLVLDRILIWLQIKHFIENSE